MLIVNENVYEKVSDIFSDYFNPSFLIVNPDSDKNNDQRVSTYAIYCILKTKATLLPVVQCWAKAVSACNFVRSCISDVGCALYFNLLPLTM